MSLHVLDSIIGIIVIICQLLINQFANLSDMLTFKYKTGNMLRQTNSLKVFQIFGLLVMGVSLNVWGNELLHRGLHSLRALLFLPLFHEEI